MIIAIYCKIITVKVCRSVECNTDLYTTVYYYIRQVMFRNWVVRRVVLSVKRLPSPKNRSCERRLTSHALCQKRIHPISPLLSTEQDRKLVPILFSCVFLKYVPKFLYINFSQFKPQKFQSSCQFLCGLLWTFVGIGRRPLVHC